MIKKIMLSVLLIFSFVLMQSPSISQERYIKTFYMSAIKKTVEQNWILPINNKGKSTIVSFTVLDDGNVEDVEILRSSEDAEFDASVVSSIYKSAPFHYSSNLDEPITVSLFFSPIFTEISEITNNSPLESNIVNVASISPYIHFSDYTDRLQNKINDNWQPKTRAKKRMAIASVNIANDGSLNNFYMVKSSRNKKFDKNILDTIAKTVPMDAFPDGINAPDTDIQLIFNYSKSDSKDKNAYNGHYVLANVMNVKGYDKYTKLAERVLADNFRNQRYFCYKDLIVEMAINKVGKLKYVKVKKSSGNKNFDRKMLAIIQKTSFPPIPETIPFNDVILNYEIVTQRSSCFTDVLYDYLIHGGKKGLKSFNLAEERY